MCTREMVRGELGSEAGQRQVAGRPRAPSSNWAEMLLGTCSALEEEGEPFTVVQVKMADWQNDFFFHRQ